MEKEFVFKKGSVVVKTNKGKVRGYAYNGVSVFKGIPYAKAKRFHAPEPLEAWEGELDATSFGYVCPLLEMPKPAGHVMKRSVLFQYGFTAAALKLVLQLSTLRMRVKT